MVAFIPQQKPTSLKSPKDNPSCYNAPSLHHLIWQPSLSPKFLHHCLHLPHPQSNQPTKTMVTTFVASIKNLQLLVKKKKNQEPSAKLEDPSLLNLCCSFNIKHVLIHQGLIKNQGKASFLLMFSISHTEQLQ